MWLTDKIRSFNERRAQNRIKHCLKVVSNSKAIKEERMAAIGFFADMNDPSVAIPALLSRFEYSLEHGINDTREKELAMRGIVKYQPEEILPFLQAHLKQTTRIAWPMKVLFDVVHDEEKIVEVLLSLLNYSDISFDQAAVDKNYDILCYLADYKSDIITDKIRVFLNDVDERVRFACIEVILNQNLDDSIKEYLEPFLMDSSVENRRIRIAVIDLFISRGWKVSDVKKFESVTFDDNVFLTKKGKFEKRVPIS